MSGVHTGFPSLVRGVRMHLEVTMVSDLDPTLPQSI